MNSRAPERALGTSIPSWWPVCFRRSLISCQYCGSRGHFSAKEVIRALIGSGSMSPKPSGGLPSCISVCERLLRPRQVVGGRLARDDRGGADRDVLAEGRFLPQSIVARERYGFRGVLATDDLRDHVNRCNLVGVEFGQIRAVQ